MESITVLALIIVVAFGIVLALFIKSRSELSALNNKYGAISNVENERDKIQREIDALISERDKINSEFLKKKGQLTAQYDSAYKTFEKLQGEINLLEESLDMIEYGFYKPHFEYDSPDEFKHALEELREKEKVMIRSDLAVICSTEWSVEGSKAAGKKMTKQNHKLMLRAFNGECDAALAKVRWDNIVKMKERIKKAFDTINKSAEVNRSYITRNYFDLKIRELMLTYELQEKIKLEKEEQRQIREQMRDEERAQKEIEKAREEAEKEEVRFSKALDKAREEIQGATGDKYLKLKEKVAQLESQLKEAQELKQRAISRAQLTKSGHVYIISNIGSFGENIYKIGMTRRLEPGERIKELGDASVPFAYDVHAMIYTENAPELESKLHKQFEQKRLNLINLRREFFSVTLSELEEWAKKENLDLKLTKISEASEFRQSVAIRTKDNELIEKPHIQTKEIPSSIEGLFSEVG